MAMTKNGKHYWALYHLTPWYYPDEPTEEEKVKSREFMESMTGQLICQICRDDFGQWIREHPPNTNSRAEFFQWSVDGHNFVNRKLGKPEVDYQTAVRYVSHLVQTGNFPSSAEELSGLKEDEERELHQSLKVKATVPAAGQGRQWPPTKRHFYAEPPTKGSKEILLLVLGFVVVAAVVYVILRSIADCRECDQPQIPITTNPLLTASYPQKHKIVYIMKS